MNSRQKQVVRLAFGSDVTIRQTEQVEIRRDGALIGSGATLARAMADGLAFTVPGVVRASTMDRNRGTLPATLARVARSGVRTVDETRGRPDALQGIVGDVVGGATRRPPDTAPQRNGSFYG